MKIKSNNLLYKKRLAILESAKRIVMFHGWNNNTFNMIAKNKNFSINEMNILFPEGYVDLLKFSLEHINFRLEKKFKNINLSKMPLHKRIRKIFISKFLLINENKSFYKKVFFHILLPNNNKLLLKQLYKSVDLMWYISGDHSTDFNFYTKRIILAGIYTRVIIFYFNNNDFEKAVEILDNSLSIVSKIPKYKSRLTIFKEKIPSMFRFVRNY